MTRRWVLLGVAVIAGVAIGLALTIGGLGGRQPRPSPPPTPAAASLRLEAPVALLPPDAARNVDVTVTLTTSRALLIGTEDGMVFSAPLPPRGEAVTVPDQPLAHIPSRVTDLAVSPDGETFAAISFVDGSLAVGTGGSPAGTVPGSLYSIVGISADGRRLALGGFGVSTFDLTTGAKATDYQQPMAEGGRGAYEDVVVTATGTVVALSPEGVDVWAPGSTTTDGATRSCNCAARAMALSSDGRRAVFGTADGHLVVLDTDSGDVLVDKTVSAAPNHAVQTAAITADGALAVGLSTGGAAVLWDLQDGAAVWQGRIPVASVTRAYFTPQGDALVLESDADGASLQAWRVDLVRPGRSTT